MKICETHGDWIVTAERAGTISGQHLSLGTQWTIESQPDGEYRLTVCPDDTTYAWLMFQTRQEAQHWVTKAMCSGPLIADSTISRHIVEWLNATHSNS
jgi:hypothetical protein